jgi:SRSO17 transposase
MARQRDGERPRTTARRLERREAKRAQREAVHGRGREARTSMKPVVAVGRLRAPDVEGVVQRIEEYLVPYRALMGRKPRQRHLSTFMEGLLGHLERKSVEPIALSHGLDRKPLQHFVGVSPWDDRPLLDHLRKEVATTIGDKNGVLIVDPSSVPKKGTESVGVARQWCGRLGKVENCQVGTYLAYAGRGSCTLIDRRLYLPRDWARDAARRNSVHVPAKVVFKTTWQQGLEMIRVAQRVVPAKWVTGDDELGRPSKFRDGVAAMGLRYVLEVPVNIVVRRRRGRGAGRPPTWHRLSTFIKRIPVTAWSPFKLRDGEKGPIEVRAAMCRLETRRGRYKTMQETLLVMETLNGSQRWCFLSNAAMRTPIATLVEVAAKRHLIEQKFQVAKGDTGLDHYEVRTWQGWHHHTACSLIAEWFLVREQRRLGEKVPPMTAQLVRLIVSEMLRPRLDPSDIARLLNYQVRRNEEARIARWRAKGLEAPPKRAVA